MAELILCPKCGEPTIKERVVYPPEEQEHRDLDDYIGERVEHFSHLPVPSSRELSYGVELPRPTQIVYRCSACGYTNVINLEEIN